MCSETAEVCSACLKSADGLAPIAETDAGNVSWRDKLAQCVPEIEWLDGYHICAACGEMLEQALTFRATCLSSDELRRRLVLKDEPVDDDGCECEAPGDDLFVCYHCGEGFDEKGPLERHVNGECELRKAAAKKSRRRTNRITEFACEACPQVFKSSGKLVRHCVAEHSIDAAAVKPFCCGLCGKRFSSSSNLGQHKKYHEGNRAYVCSYCGKGFITSTDLLNHEKQHLNRREYKCEACGKGFNTHKDLRTHNIVKHKDPSTWNHQCPLCDKRFHIKPNYDNHLRRHSGDKRFACNICEKCFITKTELQKHMLSHSNVRAHGCERCGKEYKDRRVLAIHLARDHGVGNVKVPVRERKHRCDVCAKAFYDKTKLTRHLFTHSGEKPFSCRLCEKRFTDRSYVRQHMRSAHKVFEESDDR